MKLREFWLRQWSDEQPDGFLSGNVTQTTSYDVFEKPEPDTFRVVDVPPGNIIIDREMFREACKMTQDHLIANWKTAPMFDKMLEWYLFGSEENKVQGE